VGRQIDDRGFLGDFVSILPLVGAGAPDALCAPPTRTTSGVRYVSR
jgi:hypothetical protein